MFEKFSIACHRGQLQNSIAAGINFLLAGRMDDFAAELLYV
jgi:hypothetical protein